MQLGNVPRELLIDAVMGRCVPSEYADLWERTGLCRLAGPSWKFNREALSRLNHQELGQLYYETRQQE